MQPGTAFAERERLVAAGLHLAEGEIPDQQDYQRKRQYLDENGLQQLRGIGLLGILHIILFQYFMDFRVGREGLKRATPAELTADCHARPDSGDLVGLKRHFGDLPVPRVIQEFRIRKLIRLFLFVFAEKKTEPLGSEENPIIWSFVPSGEMERVSAGARDVADLLHDKTGLYFETNVASIA